MPTRHINPSSQLPPPPATNEDVIHALRDLITQLQNTQNERGLAINSLINGYMNSIHGGVQDQLVYAPATVENQLPLEAGVVFVPTAANGVGVTINGIDSTGSADGRIICLANISLVDNLTLNSGSVLAAQEDRLMMNAAAVTVVPRRSILFWRWAGNIFFPGGRWMRMTT